jgi:tRNA 2-thiouridine synthesizing protein A
MKEIEINGRMVRVVSTVDAVGLFCPMPVVKLKLELEKVEANQVVELLADDPGVQEDIPAWCKETNNKLLSIEKNEEDIFAAYVEKYGGGSF